MLTGEVARAALAPKMSKSTRVAWHEALHLDLQIGLQLSSLSGCGQCGLATSPHTGQQVSEKLELSTVWSILKKMRCRSHFEARFFEQIDLMPELEQPSTSAVSTYGIWNLCFISTD